jgi:hypothetical protein
LHLQAELSVCFAIQLNVFHCVFQFDAMALQKGIDFHPGLVTQQLAQFAQPKSCVRGTLPLVLIESDLKFSRVPVRMVWGEADTTFDVTWADWLDKTFPNSCGVRRVSGAKLFFPEEMPELITEEALRLWSR